jgi:hypothetical protein
MLTCFLAAGEHQSCGMLSGEYSPQFALFGSEPLSGLNCYDDPAEEAEKPS